MMSQIRIIGFQTVPNTSLMDPISPKSFNPSHSGTGTVKYRYTITISPRIMVIGVDSKPYVATNQAINMGPKPNARVPPMLNTEMAKPIFRPE